MIEYGFLPSSTCTLKLKLKVQLKGCTERDHAEKIARRIDQESQNDDEVRFYNKSRRVEWKHDVPQKIKKIMKSVKRILDRSGYGPLDDVERYERYE